MREATARAFYRLLSYARAHALIGEADVVYAQNALLDALRLDEADLMDGRDAIDADLPETAAPMLAALIDDAVDRGVFDLSDGPATRREMLEARIMGLLTPWPDAVQGRFLERERAGGAVAATDWFYDFCRASNYIRVDDIKRNRRYFAKTDVAELEITINLSKPEKTPEEIARLKTQPAAGYPKCLLCVENEGYAGRLNHPARQNLRLIPMALHGERWYFQYSPYSYYPEHCIVLARRHRDMALTRDAFERLFDFLDRFPHYFIGSNADLPIVGGSILNHDHFQGGRYRFPMQDSRVIASLTPAFAGGLEVRVLDWPMTTLRLSSPDRQACIDAAVRILAAWREYSDPSLQILHETVVDGVRVPHNTITPILRRGEAGYELDLVLRNNRVTEAFPRGLFHPRPELHNIKQENIGLIEVMGLFILPGRLLEETERVVEILCGEAAFAPEAMGAADPLYKHRDWIRGLVARYGRGMEKEAARSAVLQAVADVCALVLKDAGVFKRDPEGEAGVLRFVRSIGT